MEVSTAVMGEPMSPTPGEGPVDSSSEARYGREGQNEIAVNRRGELAEIGPIVAALACRTEMAWRGHGRVREVAWVREWPDLTCRVD